MDCQSTEIIIVAEQSVRVLQLGNAATTGLGAREWAVTGRVWGAQGTRGTEPHFLHQEILTRADVWRNRFVRAVESSQGSCRRNKKFLVSGRERLGRLGRVIDISRLKCLPGRRTNSFTHHICTMHILCAWHCAVSWEVKGKQKTQTLSSKT